MHTWIDEIETDTHCCFLIQTAHSDYYFHTFPSVLTFQNHAKQFSNENSGRYCGCGQENHGWQLSVLYFIDLEMRLGFLGRPDSGASSSTPSSSSGATQGVPVHMRQGSTGAGGSGSSATPMHHHLHGGSMTPDFHMSSPSHFVHQSPNKMLNQQQGSNAGQMGWPGAGDVGLMKGEANSHLALEAKGGQQEDVEVMSTDSSSSSSTDSN